jgi:hypothetical protein
MLATGEDLTRECIEECIECHRICVATLAVHLRPGAQPIPPEHAKLLLDASQASETAVDFMLRGSELAETIARAAGDVCERTASVLESAAGDGPLQACAQHCRRAAGACARFTAPRGSA